MLIPRPSLKEAYRKGGVSVFLMMAPTVLLFATVSCYPLAWVLRFVFYDYNGFKQYFIGFDNFIRLFTRDVLYWKSVLHTFEYAILKLAFILPIALASAVLLNRKFRGNGFFRVVYFIPTVISAAVYSLIFYFILSSYNGVLNGLLKGAGLIRAPIDWLGNPSYAMGSVIIVAVWGGFGNYMILFLAGLQSIPEDIYESARIEGASRIQTFFKITLPMLGPIMKVVLMLAITTALKDYESIMVLTGGGPAGRTEVMFLYIYKLMFGDENAQSGVQIGYGASASIVSMAIIGVVTMLYYRLSKKLDDVY